MTPEERIATLEEQVKGLTHLFDQYKQSHHGSHELQWEAHQRAHDLNERTMDAKFEKVNEMRGMLTDMTSEFARNTDLSQLRDKSREDIDALRAINIATAGRDKGISLAWGVVLAVVAIALVVVGYFLK